MQRLTVTFVAFLRIIIIINKLIIMSEEKKNGIIDKIIEVKGDMDTSIQDSYRSFLESLSNEELQNLYDELVLDDDL